ncbi:phytoene/squalene synthase family protein [Sphingomonas baiyangensis]|uniref:Phytoene/squalene synthase family protein n=1 Tax=Sphingomonas baiyangensis TaxID=2572576 RepID=A0A4U1L9D0_9SPHN|nr:phytoene/squalene synthase family protein [Sphingomonas baiyangensis]TKD53153.1 phytoene/squalene synthase family protein [Sphingomonas baiyangensis]
MTHPLPQRAAIVATARESIERGSRSFAAASKLFDPVTRERAWLLYAWCRACDDVADGQDHGHGMTLVADAPERVAALRAATARAFAGEQVGDPAFDALRIVAAETRLPRAFADDMIDGFQLDADDWRPRSEADLYRYCYHVAGVVGCMMAVVMGVDPSDDATLDRACDLGLAFQLANIARDIEEDDRVGRCYLPVEWLVEMDIPPGQHMKPPFRSRLAVLARRLADRAEAHAESARAGTPALPFRSAWAVLAAAGIYGDIARKVAAAGEHGWNHRATTSAAEKLGWIARSLGQAARRATLYPPTPRDPALWTRPRGERPANPTG